MTIEAFFLLIYAISVAMMLWLMRSPNECTEWGLVLLMIFCPVLNTALAVWSMKWEAA
jgi:hypothetical protein